MNTSKSNQNKKFVLDKFIEELKKKLNDNECINSLDELSRSVHNQGKVDIKEYIERNIIKPLEVHKQNMINDKTNTCGRQLNYVINNHIKQLCIQKIISKNVSITEEELIDNLNFWVDLYLCCRVCPIHKNFFTNMRYEGFSKDGTCHHGLTALVEHLKSFFTEQEIIDNNQFYEHISNLKNSLMTLNMCSYKHYINLLKEADISKEIEKLKKIGKANPKSEIDNFIESNIHIFSDEFRVSSFKNFIKNLKTPNDYIDIMLSQIDSFINDSKVYINKNMIYIYLTSIAEFQYEKQLSELEINLVETLKKSIKLKDISNLFSAFKDKTKNQLEIELNKITLNINTDTIDHNRIIEVLLKNKAIIKDCCNYVFNKINKNFNLNFEYFIQFYHYLIQSNHKIIFEKFSYSNTITAIIFSYSLFIALFENKRCDVFDKGETWNRDSNPVHFKYKERTFINLLKDLKKHSHYETDYYRMYNLILLIKRIISNQINFTKGQTEYDRIEKFHQNNKRIRNNAKKLCLYPKYQFQFTLNANDYQDSVKIIENLKMIFDLYFEEKKSDSRNTNEILLKLRRAEESYNYSKDESYVQCSLESVNNTARLLNMEVNHSVEYFALLDWPTKFEDRDHIDT